ncbi:MAG: thioredoxin domain-containing protein [Chloroflexota bacterium]|nr:thioredoxin domain-containing protein [Chloroflexota bacterium]
MNRLNRATAFLLSLLLMLALSACGTQDVVYVVVTATPEANEDVEAATPEVEESDSTTSAGQIGDSTVPLPPEQESADSEAEESEAEEPATNSETTLSPPPAEEGRIAFMGPYGESGPFHAFVSNADGTGLRFLSESLDEGFFPHLSPDGSQVAFTASTESGDADIFVADVASGEATNITNKQGQDLQPIWSPDGSQIAFVSEREGGDADIWLMDADGSNPRRLARTAGDDVLGSWSPDGSQIVYSNRSEVGETLWLIDIEGGETTSLSESEEGTESAPAWSPDGELIAFFATPNQSTPPQIYTIRPDGSERQQVTEGATPAVFPVWSPDGDWLAYTVVGAGNQLNLVALNLESEEVHPIPEVQGLATSWRAADEVLADTGVTQGPKQAGVEVSPEVLEAAYRKGDPDAPVTIVEFSDYQCPFCQRWFNDTLPELEPYIEDGTVQLIFVDFPLTIHPQAPAAAQAARCAGELGGSEAYWTMHDALFNSMDRWAGQQSPATIFNEIAEEVGLDGEEIQACVESGRFEEQVNAGLAEGLRLGVSGTPTFFINGDRLVGAQPFEAFEAYLP